MADVISRIKVEAQGADQAAREILKLRDAYREAGEAARGLSSSAGGGGSDPFAKATAAGGGAAQGNSPADIAARESRDRHWKEGVKAREGKNTDLQGGVQRGFGVAESLASGKGGSAAGGLLSGIGSVLGGPIGIAAMVASVAAMGVQKFADSSFGRLQEVFGSGMAQRLGGSPMDIDRQRLGFSRMGVPVGMVKAFYDAAGVSGVDMTRTSTQGAINASMEAAALLGVDPSAMAGLVGSLNRSGVSAGVVDRGLFSMGRSSFGQANVSLFTQSLQGLVDSASGRGIDLTSGSVTTMSENLAALAKLGGFSAPGAATFAQTLQSRGVSAAGLSNPEDIIAFQAMREGGASVTDTMLAMERSPETVNKKVYEYLKEATGGDTDLLRMRLQSYLGEGTTMSAVDKFIKTQEGMAAGASLGAGDTSWATVGTGTDMERSIQIMQARQNEMLKEFSDGMLDLTTGISEMMMKTFKTVPTFDPAGMTSKGYKPDMTAAIDATLAAVQAVSIQDVGNLSVVLKSPDLTGSQTTSLLKLVADPRFARTLSTTDALRKDPALNEMVGTLYTRAGPSYASRWRDFEEGTSAIGSWGFAAKDIAGGTIQTLSEEFTKKKGFLGTGGYENPAAAAAWADLSGRYYKMFGGLSDDITIQKFAELMEALTVMIRETGFVYTDGDWRYQGGTPK